MAGFGRVATLADQLAGEGSRLKKRAAIAEAIAAIAAESLDDAGLFALYLAGTPFAEADSRKLNAGGALLSRTLLTVSGATEAQLSAAYRRHGDLGAAAFDLLDGRTPSDPTLSLTEVAEAFSGMATARTTVIRAALLEGLLRRSTALEAKYLLKLILGDMRIGVKQSLVEEAIAISATDAHAAANTSAEPVPVSAVRHAVMLEADLAGAVRRAFEGTLGRARMRLFHPLGFMLASPVDSPEEAIDRFTAKPPKTATKPRSKRPPKPSPKLSPNPSPEPEDPEAFEDAPALDLLPAKPEPDTSSAFELPSAAGEAPTVQAFLEDKYDGMRAQIHCGDSAQPRRVAIYSRNRDDITESFPELEEALRPRLRDRRGRPHLRR